MYNVVAVVTLDKTRNSLFLLYCYNKQMYLIKKMFNNEKIRNVWNKKEEKYYISFVDIVTVLVDSKDPRHYWNALKSRLKKEGHETVTNCDQLKLKVQDGKYRMSDIEGALVDLGENVVSKDNALSYDYVEDDLMLENNDYIY